MRFEREIFHRDGYYGFKFDYSDERSLNFEFIGELYIVEWCYIEICQISLSRRVEA